VNKNVFCILYYQHNGSLLLFTHQCIKIEERVSGHKWQQFKSQNEHNVLESCRPSPTLQGLQQPKHFILHIFFHKKEIKGAKYKLTAFYMLIHSSKNIVVIYPKDPHLC
jgi:hypothetical protein